MCEGLGPTWIANVSVKVAARVLSTVDMVLLFAPRLFVYCTKHVLDPSKLMQTDDLEPPKPFCLLIPYHLPQRESTILQCGHFKNTLLPGVILPRGLSLHTE